jgi:hypothetical protein
VHKFDVLLRFNELQKHKKVVDDKEVHDSCLVPLTLSSDIVPETLDKVFLQANDPAPLTLSSDIVPEILHKVFLQDNDNALFQ